MEKNKKDSTLFNNLLIKTATAILNSNMISEDQKSKLLEFGMRIVGGNPSEHSVNKALNFIASEDGKEAVKKVLLTDDPVLDVIADYDIDNYKGLGFSTDFLDFDKEYFEENHPSDTDFVTAYISGKTPYESAGVIRVPDTDSTRLGRYGNYINLNYEGRDIPVFQAYRDTLDAELVKQLNLASFNKETKVYGASSDDDSAFPFGSHKSQEESGYYDAGGYNIEMIDGPDGTTYYRKSDMYDFLPEDFKKSWINSKYKGLIQLVETVDKGGNPFIFRTPWAIIDEGVPMDTGMDYMTNIPPVLGGNKPKPNTYGPGGDMKNNNEINPAIVTQDDSFNKFLMTLPENQRQTPESEYYTYKMWKIAGQPKDFEHAKNMGLYSWHDDDKSYHGNSVIYDEASDVYHFLKPKHHSTVSKELDWYLKGVHTDGEGNQHPLEGREREEWEEFRRNYYLDSSGDDYAYRRNPSLETPSKTKTAIETVLQKGLDDAFKHRMTSIERSLSEQEVNRFETGGPTDGDNKPSKKDVEDVVRTTRGATGSIFGWNFPWIDVNHLGYLYDAWKVMKGDKSYVAPTDNNYTGTMMVGKGVKTDNGLGFTSQQDLVDALGYVPKDFVDAYVYGDIPFEELGVIKKTESPERHIIRTKVGKVENEGNRMPTYQTHRDTLSAGMVHKLDSLLNVGQVDIYSGNSTHQNSSFNIGDSGIIYDGNNYVNAYAYLPNGQPVAKAIDVFDTDPSEWNYNIGPMAKQGLSFIHNNTSPFIMTTPWFYPEYSKDYVARLENLFGIRVDPNDFYVYENKGDKNGIKWDLHEALDWIDTHPDLTEMPVKSKKPEEYEDYYYEYGSGGKVSNPSNNEDNKFLLEEFPSGFELDINIPSNSKIVVPYRSVITPEMDTELIRESDNKFDTFVEKMYPIIEQSLLRRGYSINNIENILKQMALESNYGLNARGNGYNLSGIKAWSEKDGTKHSDGYYYRNFKNYSDYADFYVDLLNNRYDALNATSSDDYIKRLHSGKDGLKYSADEGAYSRNFKSMKSLNEAIRKYLKK